MVERFGDLENFNREARRAKSSYDGLEFILKKYIDFNPDKLRQTLFEYACKTLEKEGMSTREHSHCIDFLMRLKLTDILKKVYSASRKTEDSLFLSSNSEDIGNLVEYEHQFSHNASFPWFIVNHPKHYECGHYVFSR